MALTEEWEEPMRQIPVLWVRILDGLEQAAAGTTCDRGDFSPYLAEEGGVE